jgi:hypothetical protein
MRSTLIICFGLIPLTCIERVFGLGHGRSLRLYHALMRENLGLLAMTGRPSPAATETAPRPEDPSPPRQESVLN